MAIDYSSLLNENQLKAVTSHSQNVRVVAGAGSGKTRVLTYRIVYLIDEMNIEPSKILAVTFTNKAAGEMKNRVGNLIPEAYSLLQISTIHAFCAMFLRNECALIGYPRNFSILDEDDQKTLIRNIASNHGLKKGDPFVKSLIKMIRNWKSQGKYPEDVSLRANPIEDEKDALNYYYEYEETKHLQCCLDFDDLILKTVAILSEDEETRQKWSQKYSHILVDEFQDINNIDNRLFTLLSNQNTSFYVVGDPDQTIYTWRGADQSIIMNFASKHGDCEDVVLDKNYRSTSNILNAANSLISHNKKRLPKNLYTDEENGEEVIARQFSSDEKEANWVVQEICRLCKDEDYRKVAILYRSSFQTKAVESAMGREKIPYRIFGGIRFYQRAEVKDVIAYLRLIINPLDEVAFDRIINVPRRGLGEKALAMIKEGAQELHISQYNYLGYLKDNPDESFSDKTLERLANFYDKVEDAKDRFKEGSEIYSSVLDDFLTKLEYYAYLAKEEDPDDDKVANVKTFLQDLEHQIENYPDTTLEEYLQNISLLTGQDDMTDQNYVTLSTIHLAKGLEFDYIFIISMNEGAFPNNKAMEEKDRDGPEEERRLCYVGMTRAKKRLYMSCHSGYFYQTNDHFLPSRYFSEAKLKFPQNEGHRGYNSFRNGREGQNDFYWGRDNYKNRFYEDGDHIDPFKKEKKGINKKPETNGVTDWLIGERVIHDKFGEGTIVEMLSKEVMIVEFDQGGKKTMLASHPAIKRVDKKGGTA